MKAPVEMVGRTQGENSANVRSVPIGTTAPLTRLPVQMDELPFLDPLPMLAGAVSFLQEDFNGVSGWQTYRYLNDLRSLLVIYQSLRLL